MKSIFYSIAVIALISCKKDWLDKKRDIHTVVPTTLEDMRLLLNNTGIFSNDFIGLAHVSTDDYYLTDPTWRNLSSVIEKNAHIWEKDIYPGVTTIAEWNSSYNQVFTANVILDGLKKINVSSFSEITEWNDIKGGALLYRGKAFYNLAQLYSQPYLNSTAEIELGIPLKLSSDVNSATTRSNLKETYDQIIQDLKNAAQHLNVISKFKTDATKSAAFGYLARCYLSMSLYDSAFIYADSCLKTTNATLLDYNNVSTSTNPTYTLPVFSNNSEIIHYSLLSPNYTGAISTSRAIVDSNIYSSYDSNDLRKAIFTLNASGSPAFRGNYTQSVVLFSGIALDEIYIIRAECYARKGLVDKCMQDINLLYQKRWKKSAPYMPLAATNSNEALAMALKERRKELLYRGLRWSDLRRLNRDNTFALTLKRQVNSGTYLLQPNDTKYVLPIPDNVIQLSSIEQNPR